MTIKVINKHTKMDPVIYKDVKDVISTFDENRNYCHQIINYDGSTATFPASDWSFYKLQYVEMF